MNDTKNFSVTSNTLMSNQQTSVEIFPSDSGKIKFFLAGQQISADVENVVSTQNCTVIGNSNIKVALIEHLMATFAILNISSVDVCLSNFEIPILDGSAKNWCELLLPLKNERNDEYYVLTEPVYFKKGNTEFFVFPNDKFELSYLVDFNHKDLKQKWVNLDEEKINEIIEARTFGYYADLEKLQSMGLAQGVSIDNTVGLMEDGSYTTDLRSDLEPAKHKILDLLGDFYLSGINPFNMKIRVIVKQAGHETHVEMAKILKNKLVREA